MANKSIFKPNPFSTWDLTKQDAFSAVRLSDAITVDGNDLLLTYVDGELSSEIRMSLSSGKLTLSGQNGIINEVELPDEDTILKSADYDNETKEIVLVFETKDGQETPMRINVADLVDEYTAGNGLKLNEKEFSIDEEIVATVAGVEAVKTELEGKINDVNTTVGEHASSIEAINTALEGKLDASTYNDEKATFETVEHAEETYQPKGDYLTEHQDLSEYAKTTDVEEKLDEKQDKGDYVEYSDYQGRKTIQLKNYDSISGIKTDGSGVNIAMVSKWDVADFGSTQLPINLNGKKERPTYNDDKELALLSDIPSVEGYVKEEKLNEYALNENVETLSGEVAVLEADKIDDLTNTNGLKINKLGVAEGGDGKKNRVVEIGLDDETMEKINRDFVVWSEYSGQEGRKILKLAHRDTIAGESPKGGSQIAMVSDYDDLDYPVVELGSTRAAMVINSVEDRVKVEVNENGSRKQHSIATVDDLVDLAKVSDVTTEINNAVANKADKSELETKQDKGDYVTFKEFDGGRKTINLRNRDTIASEGSQIAMVSTYDGLAFPVLELGGTKEAMVLNTCEDRVKVEVVEEGKRVQHAVATLDDLKDFPKYEPYVNGDINKKTIVLENDDNISGKRTDGLGVNLIEVSRWNVADISSKSVHTNLNGMYERPTYNDKEGIALLSDIAAVRAEMKSYVDALLKNYTLKSDEEIKEEITKGGDFTLASDINITSKFALAKPTNLDLNENKIENTTAGQDAFNFGPGNFTIKNGTVDNSIGGGSSAAFYMNSSKGTNLTLENVNATGVYCVYLNNATVPPTCTINGGTFVSPNDKGVCVYVEKGGYAEILDGYFTTNGHDSTYLLNLKDSLNEGHDPREYICVKGGTYVNFNPSASYSEPNGPVNFVADGYHVEEKVINETTTEYTVVKDSE